jgi:hypothetical protein
MYAPRIFGSSPVNDSRESAMQSILPAFTKSTAAATLATSTWVAFGEALLEARKVAVPAPAMRTPARERIRLARRAFGRVRFRGRWRHRDIDRSHA